MNVENIGSTGPTRPSAVPDDRDRADRKAVPQISRVPARDRVEISERGRALAAREELAAWLQTEVGLSAEAAAALLARLDQGAYNEPGVAREVARRLLMSGDL